jgi:hypothetical protein
VTMIVTALLLFIASAVIAYDGWVAWKRMSGTVEVTPAVASD